MKIKDTLSHDPHDFISHNLQNINTNVKVLGQLWKTYEWLARHDWTIL